MRSLVRRTAMIAALAALAATSGRADVQQTFDVYVQGLSLDGRISINGTTIEKYGSAFAPDVDVSDDAALLIAPVGAYVDPLVDVPVESPQYLWSSLVVEGSDRYALRRDGRIKLNDVNRLDLPSTGSPWLDLARSGGRTYAVRADGVVAVDGAVIDDHVEGRYHFRRIVHDGFDAFSLRSDGSVFRAGDIPMFFAFRAGGDGQTLRTSWIAAAVDPAAEYLYALRADGVVARGKLFQGTLFGERVAQLPFDPLAAPLLGQVYVDLEFTPDGTWYALAGDGRVYTQADHVLPLADLPGSANSLGRLYSDLAVAGDWWFALRSDGRVFQNGALDPIYDLPQVKYGSLGVSWVAPTLVKQETKSPRIAIQKTRIVQGTPLVLPVAVSDLDTCAEDLVAAPVGLPPGATWDPAQGPFGALVWNAPGPAGDYAFRFTVTDGTNSKQATYKIKVKEPDVDPDTNRGPLVPSFGKVRAVAGQELVLRVIADDRDGDPATVTVDGTTHPFTIGATFNGLTNEFRWTPRAVDAGTATVRLFVSDGAKRKVVTVRIRVKIGLFY